MAYLTDGFVPQWFVKERPRGVVLAKRLVQADLWLVGECNGESGWWFHQWKPECMKSHVLDVREKARLRKAKSRESQPPSRVTDGGRDAGVLGFTQTNPNQPITSMADSSGGVTQVGPTGPPPRPQCNDHEENFDGPCRPCKKRREWDEKYAAQAESDELERKRSAKAAAAQVRRECQCCDEDGWLLDADGTPAEPATKCNHQGLAHA